VHDDALMAILLFLFSSMSLLATYRLIVRWLDRKRSLPTANDHALEERLARIEQIVEATAIEVERVAEGQRFTTKILAERTGDNVSPSRSAGRTITPH